jgi:hypothetical protein
VISWFAAAAWFLLGALVARYFAFRSRTIESETVIIGIDRKHRKVTLQFTKLGGEYGIGPEDACAIAGYLQKQAAKFGRTE